MEHINTLFFVCLLCAAYLTTGEVRTQSYLEFEIEELNQRIALAESEGYDLSEARSHLANASSLLAENKTEEASVLLEIVESELNRIENLKKAKKESFIVITVLSILFIVLLLGSIYKKKLVPQKKEEKIDEENIKERKPPAGLPDDMFPKPKER